jgi:hypothetical protein
MPLDGIGPRKDPPPDPGDMPSVPCYVIGGCANGALLPAVLLGAEHIALKRPSYIKPLASAVQKIPDIANESDVYELHPMSLTNDAGNLAIMLFAVIEGKSLEWAFKQLIVAYGEKTVAELKAAGLAPPGTKSPKKP